MTQRRPNTAFGRFCFASFYSKCVVCASFVFKNDATESQAPQGLQPFCVVASFYLPTLTGNTYRTHCRRQGEGSRTQPDTASGRGWSLAPLGLYVFFLFFSPQSINKNDATTHFRRNPLPASVSVRRFDFLRTTQNDATTQERRTLLYCR